MICMIFRLCMVCRKPSFGAIMQTMQIMQNVQTMQDIETMQIMQNVQTMQGIETMQTMQVMQKCRKLRVSFPKTALKRPRWPIRPAGGRMGT